jgi:hypothetical protein
VNEKEAKMLPSPGRWSPTAYGAPGSAKTRRLAKSGNISESKRFQQSGAAAVTQSATGTGCGDLAAGASQQIS